MTTKTRTNPAITNRDRESARLIGRRVVVAVSAMRRAQASLTTVAEELGEIWPDAHRDLLDFVMEEAFETDPEADPRIDPKQYDTTAARLLEIVADVRNAQPAKLSKPTDELRANLRESSGNAWDDVADVRGELSAMRGEANAPATPGAAE
jgi:hypothetical protein